MSSVYEYESYEFTRRESRPEELAYNERVRLAREVERQNEVLAEVLLLGQQRDKERDEARADNAAFVQALLACHGTDVNGSYFAVTPPDAWREVAALLRGDHPGAELLARIERLEERGRRQVDDLIRQGGIIERLRAVARAVEEVTVPLMPRHMYEAFRALQPGDLGGEV